MAEYKDFPLAEIGPEVERLASAGCQCFQKFSCEKCGSRQTIDEPNHFYTSGKCQECGHVTDITKSGCNYLVIAGSAKAQDAYFKAN